MKKVHQEHRNIGKLQKFEQSSARSPERAQEIDSVEKFTEIWQGMHQYFWIDTHKLLYKFNKMVLINLKAVLLNLEECGCVDGYLIPKSKRNWLKLVGGKCQLCKVEVGYWMDTTKSQKLKKEGTRQEAINFLIEK